MNADTIKSEAVTTSVILRKLGTQALAVGHAREAIRRNEANAGPKLIAAQNRFSATLGRVITLANTTLADASSYLDDEQP